MIYTATIDGLKITDWESFHDHFQLVMGFFEGYGRNMDAWIDCMSDLHTNGEYKGLTKFNLNKGDIFIPRMDNTEAFQKRCPEILSDFVVCAAFVNKRSEFTHFYLELR